MKNLGRSDLIWRVKNCPTETILEDPADCYDPKYVYEFYKVYALDAREMYPELEEHLSTYKDTDKVDYVEMWTKPSGSSQTNWATISCEEPIRNKKSIACKSRIQ